ncbi:MAG: chemotaxis protein CheC [Candidatus Lokiarchaeota archaeon]|nr:chemotaxis protein CheC [Candidatus Lokiarchaeota archaeon]
MVKKKKIESIINGSEEFKLTPMQLDSLMELGNIGSGHAITALSQLLNRGIHMSLTSVDLIPFWKLPEKFGGRETEVFGILSFVKEDQELSILQIYEKDSIINVVNSISPEHTLISKEVSSLSDINDFILSTINEVGNILAGHYANALADLMNIKLIPGVPDVAFDALGSIMQYIVARTAESSDLVLMVNTKMDIEELDINGMIVFLPAINTLKRLFKAINVE